MLPLALIEQRIAEAIASGEIDAPAAGTGKPLNLDPYFSVHEDDRMGYAMLRSSGHVPPEVDWLKEMGDLRESVRAHPHDPRCAAWSERLAELETAWQMRLERAKKR